MMTVLSTNQAVIRTATEKSTLVEANDIALQAEVAALKEEVITLYKSHKCLKDTVNMESNRLEEVIIIKDKNLSPTPNSKEVCKKI